MWRTVPGGRDKRRDLLHVEVEVRRPSFSQLKRLKELEAEHGQLKTTQTGLAWTACFSDGRHLPGHHEPATPIIALCFILTIYSW